jgi:hypothetical protein
VSLVDFRLLESRVSLHQGSFVHPFPVFFHENTDTHRNTLGLPNRPPTRSRQCRR